MGFHLVRNIHFRKRLQRIRSDHWLTVIRRILWWGGLLLQIGCTIVACRTDTAPTAPSTTPWRAIGITILIGWALWLLCPILQLIETTVTPPPHTDDRDHATVIICVITTILIALTSSCLFFIATITPLPE